MMGVFVGGYYATQSSRFKDDPTNPQSIQREVRLPVWRGIVERVIANPLRGAGMGQLVMNKAYHDLVPPDHPLMWHAHNVVLNYALYAGLPGVLAIMGLFAAFGWRFWQLGLSADPTVRAVGIAGVLIVSGIFVRNMFNDFFVRDGAILFWALSGALFGYALRQQSVVSPARLDQ
jgi:O-antigen ligase